MKPIKQILKELFPMLDNDEISILWSRLYDTLCSSIYNKPMFNIIQLDDTLKLYYKKEYLNNMSMKTFLETKFGKTFAKNVKEYI
jgi:hypothetical protein